MQTQQISIQHSLEFKSNKGNFYHQPIFFLGKDQGLTGNRFISLHRIRRSTREDATITAANSNDAALISVTIGSDTGITSITGDVRLRAQSLTAGDRGLTADWGTPDGGTASLTNLSTTSTEYRTPYRITFTKQGTEGNVTVFDTTNDTLARALSITGLPDLGFLNVMGTGVRPKGRSRTGDTTPNGQEGKAEVLTYLYNNMEQQEVWAASGLTGVFDVSFNGLTGALKGKAAGHGITLTEPGGPTSGTVSGWSVGPTEGAFRLDNGGYIDSQASTLFNARDDVTTGMTLMTYVKLHASGTSQSVLQLGQGSTTAFQLKFENGNLVFTNGRSSVSAGSISSASNTMAAGRTFDLNRWYHIAAKIAATGSKSGMSIYVNGEKSVLARCDTTDSVTATTSGGSFQTILATSADLVAMESPASPNLKVGSDSNNLGARVPHDVALTRIFTRPLSDSEIFSNYIATIPSNTVVNNIIVG